MKRAKHLIRELRPIPSIANSVQLVFVVRFGRVCNIWAVPCDCNFHVKILCQERCSNLAEFKCESCNTKMCSEYKHESLSSFWLQTLTTWLGTRLWATATTWRHLFCHWKVIYVSHEPCAFVRIFSTGHIGQWRWWVKHVGRSLVSSKDSFDRKMTTHWITPTINH